MTIPDILFTYWEGKSFSQLHYLTILSLHKNNPTKQITVYTSKKENNSFIQWNSGEHSVDINNKIDFRTILNISDKITIKEIDFNEEYNINNNLSCVYKADIIRIIKSYEHGGIWFDFDILFIKEIPERFYNNDADIIICYYGVIATGLVCCKPGISILKNMVNSIFDILKGSPNLYQQFGPDLWTYWLKHMPHNNNIVYFEKIELYPYYASLLDSIYHTNEMIIPEETWAIHWYNGAQNTKVFINNLDMNNLTNSTFCNCIKQILNM
jgi:hypothetical protein